MLRGITGLIALAACAIWTSPVCADISYQYVTDATTYSAQPGAPVAVNIYLQETVTGLSQSLINQPGGHGLLSAGVALQQTGIVPAFATTISTISTNQSAIGAGGGFGTSGSYQTNLASDNSSAALLEQVGVATGPTTSGGKILLGTVTLTAGAAYTTTTFSVPSFTNSNKSLPLENTTGPYTVAGGLGSATFDLDPDNGSYHGANDITNTFTVTVVPEPSSLLLCGLAAGCGLYVVSRRRKTLPGKAD